MSLFDGANDTRGWVMCAVSGIACTAGALIICVDSLVRLFPGQKRFRIEESNVFLACSLSLSFGVMIFSALYNMLPASKRYLLKAGWQEQEAGFLMMSCFVGGFIGIQVISRLLHRLMPSHVVDCDHSHDEHAHDAHSEHDHGHGHTHGPSRRQSRPMHRSSKSRSPGPIMVTTLVGQNAVATESTPLLPSERAVNDTASPKNAHGSGDASRPPLHGHAATHAPDDLAFSLARRPSIIQVRDRLVSFVKDTKANCDETGPCYGYTDPCGQECFKHLSSRSALSRLPMALRTTTWFSRARPAADPISGEGRDADPTSSRCRLSRAQSHGATAAHRHHHGHGHDSAHNGHDGHIHDDSHEDGHDGHDSEASTSFYDADADAEDDVEAQHHHHVPTNAFMAIGLQTVIAIALHKFPEGFITYATNMANPALGFNVFMALFVHNIAEGFSMALPLYMALGSRAKAIALSSVLGGLSQPAGAAIAWLWFKAARRSHFRIDNVAYAALFAVTAGIMASVALQLFVESLSLNHNRNLSIAFAFLGMIMLGLSSALVDDE
ncbi:hypothetical protein MAPG_03335 [Magnaporthiopsis poae ATCC 64411]|uniref:Zinc-regulated transporter 3 n=1 Tax=Magnaporthiopsis poae (strain ATCC 64411 / 73-15) TaxID=644358 RepID=A0A0C4DTR3_MAGP6|nr:hypothetical protein MAPG_03335 [Magnaporthiopsis poae ATCC 64411]